MAVYDISTYDGLCQGVADWLNRADLTDQIPNFVQLAEAGLNRELRTRDMMVRSEAISMLEFVPLPNDFLQEFSLSINPAGQSAAPELESIGKMTADKLKSLQMRGAPIYYTLIDSAFELVPAPQSNVDLIMVYYARIPRLGEPVGTPLAPRQTNWLLTKSPDLYLASTILQAAPYLNDQQRLQTWAAMRGTIMDGMVVENERAMRSSTQLTARVQAL